MNQKEVFFNPSYEVIFKGSFDDLMEKIWGDEFVDISSWKIVGEGLKYSKTH